MNILDIGCGSGLSGEVLSEFGHVFWGLDISPSMLDVANKRFTELEKTYSTSENQNENDVTVPYCPFAEYLLSDMGQGLPFGTGFFDAAISVSAL